MKTIITFDEHGVGNGMAMVNKDLLEPHEHELPQGFAFGALVCRFKLVDGTAVDAYPGQTDEQVQAALEQTVAQAAATVEAVKPKILTKLDFMELFTDTELVAVYQMAEQSIEVRVWLDKLKLADNVSLTDARTAAGIQNLVLGGLLVQERADRILSGLHPLP